MKTIKFLSLIIILLGSITSVSTWASVRSGGAHGGGSEPYAVGGQLTGGSQVNGGLPYASGIKIARRGGHRHFRRGWGYRGGHRHFRRGWGYRSNHRHFRRGGRGFGGRGFYGRGFYGRGFGGHRFGPGIGYGGYGIPYYPHYYYGW